MPKTAGWSSNFPKFVETTKKEIREDLEKFVTDPGESQIRAWNNSISVIQREATEILQSDDKAINYSSILEYQLPMESRRTDVIFLAKNNVVVLELKGKYIPSQADLDQVSAYVRDLKCYHRECENRPVIPILVPMLAKGDLGITSGVRVVGPDYLDNIINEIVINDDVTLLAKEDFLSYTAYRPLPTLIQAARELFHSGQIRAIHRARAATDPAVDEIIQIIHEAYNTSSRKLILVTGVPGAGKTLVGLRIAHAHFLDDLAIPRENGKPSAPAVFLSGNGPLVRVLQYELKGANGGGKAFVRDVLNYVRTYSTKQSNIPPEHVLIYDEAQRAFDAEQVAEKHRDMPGFSLGKSEPDLFIEFAERVPQWCVVIGLIGSGQEIHIGEEAGIEQWSTAIEKSSKASSWTIHGPSTVKHKFKSTLNFFPSEKLNLDKEIRFHLAEDIHLYVSQLIDQKDRLATGLSSIADKLERQGYHLRITRNLNTAKSYLQERYAKNPEARYGILASSRDRDLKYFGIMNDWQSTKNTDFGPWYSDPENSSSGKSCRLLMDVITEFGAQGLELDGVLLAWGTDFKVVNGKWSNEKASRYQNSNRIKSAEQLRINAYRVLLTRGRDCNVVFVPELKELDDTYDYLLKQGFLVL
jgi:hypothetical protein